MTRRQLKTVKGTLKANIPLCLEFHCFVLPVSILIDNSLTIGHRTNSADSKVKIGKYFNPTQENTTLKSNKIALCGPDFVR
jgi:hypothetical protein